MRRTARPSTPSCLKFQQCTGPVMAKSVEDTAFYRYHRPRFPQRSGWRPCPVWGLARHVSRTQPTATATLALSRCLATATHDTKRSEDVRARIDVLSELPSEWRSVVGRCSRQHRKCANGCADGHPAPDRNDQSLSYETLLGVWPLTVYECRALRGLHATNPRLHAQSRRRKRR